MSSGDLTVDVAGDIILDADGGDIKLKDGSTIFGELTNNASADGNLDIKCPVSDADIRFKGNDGGSTITALRLDMSDAGTAVFGHDLKVADNNNMQFGSGPDLMLSSDGTNGTIENQQSNGDIIFKGSDAGSTITALTLDMSSAGKAIFNSGLAIGGTGDANTLDDFEVGNFTPVLDFGGGTTGISYSLRTGSYTKIGNIVNITIRMLLQNKGSSTGNSRITGLPFTTSSASQHTASTYNDRLSAIAPQVYNNGNQAEFQFYENRNDGTNNSTITNSAFHNTTFLIVSMQYFV